jgi:stearoyl-CoA desaturase (Delta-9 desaturase)
MDSKTTTRHGLKPDYLNISFLLGAHLLAVFAIVYLSAIHFSWWSIGLGLLWLVLCGFSITGGYHRLFAHPTYKAIAPLRLFYLLFGAASVQNSALKWSADHRDHHAETDQEDDPYNAKRGFWWSHIGWVFYKKPKSKEVNRVDDLRRDPLIRFQHRYYILIAITFGVLAPFALGFAWGDPIGALLCAGVLRLVVQWHVTFSINSFAHYIGTQPYSRATTARDSWLTALLTLGEGYHNFHHRFQNDYRNGVRWYHFDPTKWFVWALSKVGPTKDLRRMSKVAIERARAEVRKSSTHT